MSALTKVELAEDIQDELGYQLGKAKETADLVINVIKQSIFNKKLIYIPKHMKIGSSIKAERIGRNPKTGKDAVISRRHSIRAITGTFPEMNTKLTKSTFIEELQELDFSFSDATILVEVFYKFIGKIKDGENRIEIRGLGSFRSELLDARTVRNPRTGEKVNKPSYYQPMFKCSTSLRKSMDKQYL